MIDFRCWYCNKRYTKLDTQIGLQFECSCKHRLKVPRRSGGRNRVKTPLDRFVEAAVYGGGGGLLGFSLGLLIASQLVLMRQTIRIVVATSLAGFLIGLFGGERGINWLGRMIREREQQ